LSGPAAEADRRAAPPRPRASARRRGPVSRTAKARARPRSGRRSHDRGGTEARAVATGCRARPRSPTPARAAIGCGKVNDGARTDLSMRFRLMGIARPPRRWRAARIAAQATGVARPDPPPAPRVRNARETGKCWRTWSGPHPARAAQQDEAFVALTGSLQEPLGLGIAQTASGRASWRRRISCPRPRSTPAPAASEEMHRPRRRPASG